jgi:hypothetical protein
MLSWFFKKGGHTQAPVDPKVPPSPDAVRAAAAAAPAAAGPDWVTQLQDAQGDDAALLHIAASAPRLEIKMAAVQALAAEAALRQAEREFRSHDRKVHRLAKQRLEAAVAQREARARAQVLLERAAALVDEADLPINHVVELDHGWNALAADLLEPQQRTRFAALRARLDATILERGEAQQRLHRWCGDVRRRLPEWRGALVAVAGQGEALDAARLELDIRALLQARPALPAKATADLDTALEQALAAANQVESRLAWLATQAADPAAAPESPDPGEAADSGTESPLHRPETDSQPRWADLPAVADAELSRLLDQRHASWLRERAPVPSPAFVAPPARPAPGLSRARDDAMTAAQRAQVESLLQQAEQALAEGQLGGVQQHLQAIDALAGRNRAIVWPDALRGQLSALRAEGTRLKGWQQWGGARAREDLVTEAEALARQTQAATDPEAGDRPKLNLTDHAQAIQTLRQRWKALDRLGAAAPQTLWQRFDAALHAAHAPVAAQHAALQAARQENLAAREALLAGLDALPLPTGPAHAADPADPAARLALDAPPVAWKDLLRELHGFKLAWRKFGPLEHTVPAGARQALQQHLCDSLARIEQPLQALRQAAAEERERFIAEAQALVARPGQPLPWPEAARQLRELQAAWQHHARQLPLPRALESDLWARFKAATDAVFAQRDAAAAARDAGLSANLAARESLLGRLAALDAATDPAAVERTLAEVDRAWRAPVELPHGAGDALEARFRSARDAALQGLNAARTRHWQVQCDALQAGLARCESREAAAGGTADASPPWVAHDDLPAAWQQALAWRWQQPPVPGPLAEAEVDDLLLQLEAALGLPSTPERQAERRQLKLRALKAAMEGRVQPAQGPAQQGEAWLSLLRQGGLNPAQRQRLQALLAALRQAAPGTQTCAAPGPGQRKPRKPTHLTSSSGFCSQ